MLAFDLGEMRSEDGAALNYEVLDKLSKYSLRISETVKTTPIYGEFAGKLSGPRPALYFQFLIKSEIYPFIVTASVISWYKRNGKMLPSQESAVRVPKSGIHTFLNDYWDFKDVPLLLLDPSSFIFQVRGGFRRVVKEYVRRCYGKIEDELYGFGGKKRFPEIGKGEETIACHYVEGIDTSKRNDINWHESSGIPPRKVLIYIDSVNSKTGKPVTREVIDKIEARGFRWAALKKDVVEGQGSRHWSPPKIPEDLLVEEKPRSTEVDKWILKAGNNMLREVHFWRSFYDDFNVRVNYTPEEGYTKNIAQAIAFDIDRSKPGVLVGKQRSEIYFPTASALCVLYPKHIFFIWNERMEKYLRPNHEKIEFLIVSGYPNPILKRRRTSDSDFSQKLRSRGVNFVIALFDNVHGQDFHLSTNGMSEMYECILRWVIDDPAVGVIVKSKKPRVIKNLPLIHPLLEKAVSLGRCIEVENSWGKFPSEASTGADMAVGSGISSAVIEAVLGGSRGILYDMSHLKRHEFYEWGYGRLIFDDLGKMLPALKRYKEDPGSEPELGDWTPYLDKLDPFRDERGHERMGTYMRWLLEEFEAGKSGEEVVGRANSLYIKQWGADKVIRMDGRE